MWKEPQHDRAQQEQALTQPISVRTPRVALPRCAAPEHPRNPYTLALFPAVPPPCTSTYTSGLVRIFACAPTDRGTN